MSQKIFIQFLIVAGLLGLPILNCQSSAMPELIVRVLIADNKNSISLSLGGKYTISETGSGRVLMESSKLWTTVKAGKSGICIGKNETGLNRITVKAGTDSGVGVNTSKYRGYVSITLKANGKLMVVNRIDMDDYLYGVLHQEVSHRWPMESLKAQAIASRTFALRQIEDNKHQPYDLGSDVYSQVYGGSSSEKFTTTQAVDSTRGQVLVYDGVIMPAYFHATCAGHTEDASNLWKIDMAPLKGVACDFCRHSPHYRWTREVPLWFIEERLRMKGYGINRISSIEVISRNRSGRADKLEIKDPSGASVLLTGKDFRQIIGPNDVRSAKFNVQIRWGMVALEGVGWGHGVGMCQWGAFGQARKGKTAEEILSYYYPGAVVKSMEDIAN